MRILISSINYWPELTGIGKYTAEMAEWLAAKGFEVKVITAPPYYPAWDVLKGYSSIAYRKEVINGVSVLRCPLWVPRKPTGLKRILHLVSFAMTSLPVMIWSSLVWKPGLVFVVEPPLFCSIGALISAKFSGADSWLHIQDFEVDAAFDMGILNSKRTRRIAQSVELWLMSRFDFVSTISEKMMDRLSLKKIPLERQVLFENWVDTKGIYPEDKKTRIRQELGFPSDVIILLYAGNLGKKQGLEIIIEAARKLEHRNDILFVVCGNGPALDELKEISHDINNIKFIALQPLEKLNELLNMADIHLLPQRSDVADLVMPSKLTNMMASGRPVIATARTGTQVSSVVSKCGLVVNPGDVDAFVEAIESLAGDRNKRATLGVQAREIVMERWKKDDVLSEVFKNYLA